MFSVHLLSTMDVVLLSFLPTLVVRSLSSCRLVLLLCLLCVCVCVRFTFLIDFQRVLLILRMDS